MRETISVRINGQSNFIQRHVIVVVFPNLVVQKAAGAVPPEVAQFLVHDETTNCYCYYRT